MSYSKNSRQCRFGIIFIGAKYGLRLIHFCYDINQRITYYLCRDFKVIGV